MDDDNDGILDVIEAQPSGGSYIAPTGPVGNNGYYDVFETAVDNGIPRFSPENTDSTGNPDYISQFGRTLRPS